jgi:hypothetical protein
MTETSVVTISSISGERTFTMIAALHRMGIARLAYVLFLALSLLGVRSSVNAQELAATPQPISLLSAEDSIAAATAFDGVLRFDVAEDGTHFVFDPDLTDGDGMPGYGTSFVTHGYLYPAGTLSESNGVNADGSPEFPDQVLGEWICRGWFVGEGMRTTTGAMVVTSQLYSFGDTPGEAMLSSDGYELADVGVEVARAITGGTGSFVGAGGEARQILLGFNATEGVNLQYELELESATS